MMDKFQYLKQCWEVNAVSELTPVEAGLILENTKVDEEYPLDVEVWNEYASLHGLPEHSYITTAEYYRSAHYVEYAKSIARL